MKNEEKCNIIGQIKAHRIGCILRKVLETAQGTYRWRGKTKTE